MLIVHHVGSTCWTTRHWSASQSKQFVRSGIRTHAWRTRLRPERSALDHSAILTVIHNSPDSNEILTATQRYAFYYLSLYHLIFYTFRFLAEWREMQRFKLQLNQHRIPSSQKIISHQNVSLYMLYYHYISYC